MKIAAPAPAEFGLIDTKALIKEQLILMRASRVSHYDAEIKLLEEKYGGSHENLMQRRSVAE